MLAEAGSLKPRPAIASGVMTAQPATLVAWWPERGRMDQGALSRLHWMATAASGSVWMVIDPAGDQRVTAEDVRAAVADSGFTQGEERALSSGELALKLLLA